MQEVNVFGQIVYGHVMAPEERVLESNVDAAITILNVENHRVSTNFAPVLDDLDAPVAGRHQAGQVDGSNFKIPRDRNRLFDNGERQNPGNNHRLSGFEESRVQIGVGLPYGLR